MFVREASAGDAATVEGHLASAVEESSAYRGSTVPVGPFGRTLTFVAGVGETVFGSLGAGTNDGATWTITHVFVEAEAREIGLGDSLVLALLADLTHRGGQWVSAQAQPGDRAMKNLFERHGLVARTILVGRALSDPSTEGHASR